MTGPGVEPSTLPGILTTPAPWPINTQDLPARLTADGMPPLGAVEGQVLHIHQHIDIYIRGAHTVVPPYIGIRVSSAQILYAPIHTHPGEDGIIQYLIRQAQVPAQSRSFVEFGVESYQEANTRFLVLNDNWRGLIMDGSSSNIRRVRNSSIYWRHNLVAVDAFVDADKADSPVQE